MTKIVKLASYMGPKPQGETHALRYSADLIDGRVVFSGGQGGTHSVSASIPLKDINTHWTGYCGQGKYKASPKRITKTVWEAAKASQA